MALLAKTPSAQVLHLPEGDGFPCSFQSHWQAFMRMDQPTGEVWSSCCGSPGRANWITAVLASRPFPLRATRFIPPVALDLEVTQPDWLLELHEQFHPFDWVLRLESGDMVALSDDEDGLRRLTVPQGVDQE